MARQYKPTTLYFHHNADLSVTIRDSRGRELCHHRYISGLDPEQDALSFAKGWFGDHPVRIRHKYAARFKSVA